MKYALLDSANNVVETDDLLKWSRFLEDSKKRIVKQTELEDKNCRVSTIFLGLNHQYIPNGKPLWFETMIFGGPLSDNQFRCSTWSEAEAQHARVLEYAIAGVIPEDES